jgi:hypothetical protein
MRSTRARLLRQDQLLVERDAVHKITKVDHAIPHNTVIAEVTNQVTDEESTRTLRWDEHVTTEEPLEVKIGEIGKITVELVQLADEEGRPVYRYKITDGAVESIMRERIYIWVRDLCPDQHVRGEGAP